MAREAARRPRLGGIVLAAVGLACVGAHEAAAGPTIPGPTPPPVGTVQARAIPTVDPRITAIRREVSTRAPGFPLLVDVTNTSDKAITTKMSVQIPTASGGKSHGDWTMPVSVPATSKQTVRFANVQGLPSLCQPTAYRFKLDDTSVSRDAHVRPTCKFTTSATASPAMLLPGGAILAFSGFSVEGAQCGATLAVRATVTNSGTGANTWPVALSVPGKDPTWMQVNVPAGASQEITWTRPFDGTPGTYTLAFGSNSPGGPIVIEFAKVVVTPTCSYDVGLD